MESSNDRVSSPVNDMRNGGIQANGTRTEKHRLSLIFGKRASTAADKAKEVLNGTTDMTPLSPTSPLEFNHHDTLSEQGLTSDGAIISMDRPGTRQSNESTGDHSIRSRVGSVKKRISQMGIHGVVMGKGLVKKSSKGMLRNQDVVREEE